MADGGEEEVFVMADGGEEEVFVMADGGEEEVFVMADGGGEEFVMEDDGGEEAAMAGGGGEQVVTGKHLVKRRRVDNLEARDACPPKIPDPRVSKSNGGAAAPKEPVLEQVDTEMAELKIPEDVGEDDDDLELVKGEGTNWEEKMVERLRVLAEHRKKQIRSQGQLIPFQEKYTHNYEYKFQEEETDSTRAAKEEMAKEEYNFAKYRSSYESYLSVGGRFEHCTTLSPMYFTHCTPGCSPPSTAAPGSSLQIYSLKIHMKGNNTNLSWPLDVYGVVAARDQVDHNRNLLFYRHRHHCQQLTQHDTYLYLTGPSRAIFSSDPVEFEVQLMLKGRSMSRDRPLMNKRYQYCLSYNAGFYTVSLDNCLCTVELHLTQLSEAVQATVMGVRVVDGGPWTFKYGGRVACTSPPREILTTNKHGTVTEVKDMAEELVLLDSHDCDDGEMPMGSDGYLDLTRRVVSVALKKASLHVQEFEESLRVVIETYSESGKVDLQGQVKFRPKYCNISQGTCDLGGCTVEVTVAWSLFVTCKKFLL